MSRYARVLVPGGLVALVWLVYGPSLAFEFVGIDDPGYVTQNEQVLSGL